MMRCVALCIKKKNLSNLLRKEQLGVDEGMMTEEVWNVDEVYLEDVIRARFFD